MLVLEDLIGLHRTTQLQVLQNFNFRITVQKTDLDYYDIYEWFALEMNRDHCIVAIASKYCILDSFIAYDGYSISSKVFLPTVIDIIAI